MARISAFVAALVMCGAVMAGIASAAPAKSSATLDVSFGGASASALMASLRYGTPYVVFGCGYTKGVGVTVVVCSPEAISFAGHLPDANGCISLSNFATQGPGHYDLDAWQQVRNKSRIVASKSFDLS